MTNKTFVTGVSMGIIAGSAIGMLILPRKKKNSSSMVGRCLRNVGEVITDVSDALSK